MLILVNNRYSSWIRLLFNLVMENKSIKKSKNSPEGSGNKYCHHHVMFSNICVDCTREMILQQPLFVNDIFESKLRLNDNYKTCQHLSALVLLFGKGDIKNIKEEVMCIIEEADYYLSLRNKYDLLLDRHARALDFKCVCFLLNKIDPYLNYTFCFSNILKDDTEELSKFKLYSFIKELISFHTQNKILGYPTRKSPFDDDNDNRVAAQDPCHEEIAQVLEVYDKISEQKVSEQKVNLYEKCPIIITQLFESLLQSTLQISEILTENPEVFLNEGCAMVIVKNNRIDILIEFMMLGYDIVSCGFLLLESCCTNSDNDQIFEFILEQIQLPVDIYEKLAMICLNKCRQKCMGVLIKYAEKNGIHKTVQIKYETDDLLTSEDFFTNNDYEYGNPDYDDYDDYDDCDDYDDDDSSPKKKK